METTHAKPYLYWTAFIASLGGFLQSYVTCAIAGALCFICDEFNLTPFQEGTVASIILLGAITGSCFSSILADKMGRRKAILISSCIFVITSLGSFFIGSYQGLLALRFVTGIACGMVSILIPLYLVEIAPIATRGAFVTLYQFAVTFGTLIAYLVNGWLTQCGNWHLMFGIAIAPSLIQLLGLFTIPESPKWLETKGKKEIEVADDRLLTKQFSFVLIFAICLSTLQQLSGINGFVFFTPKIFSEAGFSLENAMIPTIIVGVINTIATASAIFLSDRLGRRKLLILSQAGLSVALLLLVLIFSFDFAAKGNLSLLSLLLYMASYAVGVGPITWVLGSEIFPTALRAKGIAIMTFLNWSANFIVVLTFPTLMDKLGSTTTFIFYLFFSVIALVVWILFAPETKGKTLEELGKMLYPKTKKGGTL